MVTKNQFGFNPMLEDAPVVVGITGATGSILGFELVKKLLLLGQKVMLVVSEKSFQVIYEEMGLTLPKGGTLQQDAVLAYLGIADDVPSENLACYANQQLGAPPASGTFLTKGMVVIPLSMTSLGKLASGVSDNLVCRAADVTLKEKRPLVLLPRESPLNRIHLENLLKMDAAGATVLPPVLSFYQPAFHSLQGQVDYTIGKVLDHLGLYGHGLYPRWGSPETQSLPLNISQIPQNV